LQDRYAFNNYQSESEFRVGLISRILPSRFLSALFSRLIEAGATIEDRLDDQESQTLTKIEKVKS
jgi:hypothetical protein